MNWIIGYHATQPRHYEGISRLGLLRSEPSLAQAYGIYVYREDAGFDHPTYGKGGAYRIRWSSSRSNHIWRVAYCGPFIPDPVVENAMILLQDVPPEWVTLVTGNIE